MTKRRYQGSYFKLYRALLFDDESAAFSDMPCAWRLYFWKLVSDFSFLASDFDYSGRGLSKSDSEYAKELNVSRRTIIRAREELTQQGWLKYDSRNCLYLGVDQPQGKGQYARVYREVFDRLLKAVREKTLDHQTAAVYVYLLCWRKTIAFKQERFLVPRHRFEQATQIKDPVPKIKRLEEFRFFNHDVPPFRFTERGGLEWAFSDFLVTMPVTIPVTMPVTRKRVESAP